MHYTAIWVSLLGKYTEEWGVSVPLCVTQSMPTLLEFPSDTLSYLTITVCTLYKSNL